MYQFINANPNSTRDDVSRGLGLKSSTATARIKELIDEGYIYEPQGIRKRNRSGVRSKVLRLTSRKAGGDPLDRVRVELTLTIDYNGRYGVRAKVVDGQPQSDNSVPIKTQRITITAPHPDSYKDALSDEDFGIMSDMERESFGGDIIDAEIIDQDKD